MPPKNKKDAQQEAKRLQQERKRKQEEEARLQQQRLRYASETLSTGLLLPASSQLIIDFPTKNLQFITQKLKQAIKEQYPELLQSPRINSIMKELHYFIKDSSEVFGNVTDPQSAMSHRIMVAAMFSTLIHQDKEGNGNGKNRENDERHLKDIVIKHSQKNEGKAFISKAQGLKILKYASDKYFSRFLLMKMFDKFKKKSVQKSFNIYLETPTVYTNDKTTVFIDLSEKPVEPAVEPPKQE